MTYSEIIKHLEESKMDENVINAIKSMRNELCLRCDRYRNAHLGYCDCCRWL